MFLHYNILLCLNNNIVITHEKMKMITLKSSDDKMFKIHESVEKQSKIIHRYMEDDDSSDIIQMQINSFSVQVPSDILVQVHKYCKRHVNANSPAAHDRSCEPHLPLTNHLLSLMICSPHHHSLILLLSHLLFLIWKI